MTRRKKWICGHIFQRPSGWFGEQRGDGEPEHRRCAGDTQQTSQADVVLEDGDQKHPNKGPKFADTRRYAVTGGTHAHGEHF
jgi:hypothetical protein